jgi:hypothetical protein
MRYRRQERILKTLPETRRHLLEWGITETFMRAAKGRGASQEQSVDLWRKFVRQYQGRRSTSGEVTLDYPSKARYWCLQFLSDNGWEPERYVPMRSRFPMHDPGTLAGSMALIGKVYRYAPNLVADWAGACGRTLSLSLNTSMNMAPLTLMMITLMRLDHQKSEPTRTTRTNSAPPSLAQYLLHDRGFTAAVNPHSDLCSKSLILPNFPRLLRLFS